MKVNIIAEIGMNHDGSLDRAKQLISAASECEANVAKFQTHIASVETLRDAPPPPYFTAEPRYEYFERTAFKLGEWRKLKEYCDEKGVEFLSSPFSIEAVELLERVDVSRYKIPSGEVTHLSLVERISKTGKPVLLSSGMSSWRELDEAVNTVLRYHNKLTVLQCTSEYPCPLEQVGLNVMLEMKERYKFPVGLSDHTLTNHAAFSAVTLGASVVEKHFTLSRNIYGSDAKHSLEPPEFTELVQGIRAIEKIITSPVDKNNVERFRVMKQTFEKSLVSQVEIPKGAVITDAIIGIKKPGIGLPARRYKEVLGRRTTRRIPANQILREEDIDWSSHA